MIVAAITLGHTTLRRETSRLPSLIILREGTTYLLVMRDTHPKVIRLQETTGSIDHQDLSPRHVNTESIPHLPQDPRVSTKITDCVVLHLRSLPRVMIAEHPIIPLPPKEGIANPLHLHLGIYHAPDIHLQGMLPMTAERLLPIDTLMAHLQADPGRAPHLHHLRECLAMNMTEPLPPQ